MGRLLIIEPQPVQTIAASMGMGVINLLTPDPKEVWTANGTGETVFEIMLQREQMIDTVFLGFVRSAGANTSWTVTGGPVSYDWNHLQPAIALRVPDVADHVAGTSHALWHGPAKSMRFIRIRIAQPAGDEPLSAGVLVVGRAFNAELGQEWGAGRQPIDTGSAAPLPSGGFAIVEGVRKRQFRWTFGDLSTEETDRLELLALSLGETRPGLVVEDAARTPGLRSRIFYGLFNRWSAYERRNRRQTRWEVGLTEWV